MGVTQLLALHSSQGHSEREREKVEERDRQREREREMQRKRETEKCRPNDWICRVEDGWPHVCRLLFTAQNMTSHVAAEKDFGLLSAFCLSLLADFVFVVIDANVLSRC